MKNGVNILVITIFCFSYALAQKTERVIKGQVLSATNDVTAVHVSNSTKNRGTITNYDGYFEIVAHLGDTLVFSAVQFKRKEMVVSTKILNTSFLIVSLEELVTQLSEVVITPFNLSGKLEKDVDGLHLDPVITASTENLPNAYVKPPTQSQRRLYTARTWDFTGTTIKLDPIINYFSGRTKMLNKRIAREARSKKIEKIRNYYHDSIYVKELKIPAPNIDDFVYFCVNDSLFKKTIINEDYLKVFEFMKKLSSTYIKENALEKN